MNASLHSLSARYRGVLHAHLERGSKATFQAARAFGREGLERGLLTLELARIHENALLHLKSEVLSPKKNNKVEERAELFFQEVLKPFQDALKTMNQQNADLQRKTTELADSNRSLKLEVKQRNAADVALRKSEENYRILLEKSRKMQEQLRYLSHQIILENEEQRKQISRELHDEISQILAGINVHLAALKLEAKIHTKGLSKKIANTQRLIAKSMLIVRRFATKLRPTALDDLGIIPALKTYVQDFTKRTGIHTEFTAFPEVEELNSTKRSVLFRVAQAALANITQHAEATRVQITIRKLARVVCMEIHDNGKSFEVQRVLASKMNEHLGLIGMRERVEMVGGSFSIESAPGKGTMICAEIPSIDSHRRKSPVTQREKVLLI